MAVAFKARGDDWRPIAAGAQTGFDAWFEATSHTAGAELVTRIAGLADVTDRDRLPDVDLRDCGLRVRLGPEEVALAEPISAIARDVGLVSGPAALQTLQLDIDAADPRSVASFWQSALQYQPTGDDALTDPLHRAPALRLAQLDEPRPLRNRIHLDVVWSPEVVHKIKAAIGKEPYGPFGVTLADAEGNEVDLIAGGGLAPDAGDWRTVFSAMACYPTTSVDQSVRLATAVAGIADDAGLPLLVDLRPEGVVIDSGKDRWENETGDADIRFVDLARRIESAAHDLGLSADPVRPRFLQLGIDAVDVPTVRAFWAAVLGYRYDPRTHVSDIYDPRRLNPELFFQAMDPAEESRRRQRNRIRLELAVAADQVQPRIDAAAANGGRILAEASGRWTVADPEGNEVDIVARS